MVTAAAEWGEVYALLEGGEGAAEAFSSVKDAWLVQGWLQYYTRTRSVKALEQLARAPDLHARHLLATLTDELAGDERTRARALATLAPLLARRPRWLHRVPASLTRELARLARVEHDRAPRLHALLALCPLLGNSSQPPPSSLMTDLAAALIKGLASQDPHLQVACHAAFQACYWLSPGGILGALRSEVRGAGGAEGGAGLSNLLSSVRLHPGLVLTHTHTHPPHEESVPPPLSPRPPHSTVSLAHLSALNTQTQQALPLTPGADSWFSLGEQCGTESAPETPVPVPVVPDSVELPEPAVEATPENTPAKEVRQAFLFPSEGHSRAVRVLRDDSPGMGGGGSGRLQRLVADRERATASPVSFTQAPPEHSVRPWAVRARTRPPLTPRPPPRPRSAPPGPHVSPPCPPVSTASTQTDRNEHDPNRGMLAASPLQKEEEESASSAWARLDDYLTRLYDGTCTVPQDQLAEQLQLTHAQLMYERSRREAHVERNRRLLGRCRQARGSELALGELKERVRILNAELDELRKRLSRPAVNTDALHCDALEDELERERVARVRAEAALAEVIADRDRHQAETQQLRALAAEATRRAETLEHAAELAERRSETVKRLRREIVILGEREARLAEELRGRIVPQPRPVPQPPRIDPEPAPTVSATRLNELETALATKDSQVTELKKTLLFQAEEQMARLHAMQDKYRALTHVLRRMETRLLRVGPELPEPPPSNDTSLNWSSVPLQDLLSDDEEAS